MLDWARRLLFEHCAGTDAPTPNLKQSTPSGITGRFLSQNCLAEACLVRSEVSERLCVTGEVCPMDSLSTLAPDRRGECADTQRLAASAGHADSGQDPDHVLPAHAAALGSIKPAHVSAHELRQLLPFSARKMEVLCHGLQPSFRPPCCSPSRPLLCQSAFKCDPTLERAARAGQGQAADLTGCRVFWSSNCCGLTTSSNVS